MPTSSEVGNCLLIDRNWSVDNLSSIASSAALMSGNGNLILVSMIPCTSLRMVHEDHMGTKLTNVVGPGNVKQSGDILFLRG